MTQMETITRVANESFLSKILILYAINALDNQIKMHLRVNLVKAITILYV